jgi:hypothetical protein
MVTTSTADKLICDTTANTHMVYQSRTASNETVTLSVYAKAAELTTFSLVFSDFIAHTCSAKYDLYDGTAVILISSNANYSNTSCSIQFIGNGWYRCSLTTTKAAVNPLNNPCIELIYPGTGNGSSGIYLWGAQLEAMPYMTSYIISNGTVGSRAVDIYSSVNTGRSADDIYMNTSGVDSWLNNTGEGTFVTDFMVNYTNPAADRYPGAFTIGDATWTNRIAISGYTNGQIGGANIVGNVNMADSGGIGGSNIGVFKTAALAYKTNDFAISVGGAIIHSDTSVSIYKNFFRLQIGCAGPNVNYANGHIGRIAYYPKRITNTELNSLTVQ